MNPPYHPPSAPPAQRSGKNRLLRIVLLVFLPPVALVMTWRSRRLPTALKVLLTVWCLFMTLFWLAGFAGSDPEKDTPAPAVTTTAPPTPTPPTPTPTPTPSDTPTPTPTPSPTPTPVTTPSPVPTQESGAPIPTPTPPPVVESKPPVVAPTTRTAEPEPGRTTAPASVYYKNCAAAKAAGAAPLHRGDPGYRSGLDSDDDGIACER